MWGGLGGVALQQEVHHWGRALRVPRVSPLPSSPPVLPVCSLGCELWGTALLCRLSAAKLSRHSGDSVFSVLNCKPQITLSFREQQCLTTATEKQLKHMGRF